MMQKFGFKEVYQIDGGILKYFEECGDEHYQGECFVFDKRVGVDAELNETETTQCYACRAPLLRQDLEDKRYVPSESCPYCFKQPQKKLRATQ